MTLRALQQGAISTVLYEWENDFAWVIAKARTDQNAKRGNRVSYDASKLMPSDEVASAHSAAAEIGACRILGAYCYNAIWNRKDHDLYKELPDAKWNETELEIKWRRNAYKMPVDKKDAERNRLVLWVETRMKGCECDTCNDAPPRTETRVRILGGGYAQHLWSMGTPYNNDQNRMGIPVEKLMPIKFILEKTLKTQ
jgi:hypothetical protein